MPPPALRISLRHLLVIILAQTLALFAQAWLSRAMPAHGFGELEAHYLAYLVVRPILLVMLAPLLLALPHIRGDLDQINIDPDARGRIFLQYGRDKMSAPVIS